MKVGLGGGGGQWQAATLMAMQVANGKGGNVRVLLVVEEQTPVLLRLAMGLF